MSPLHILVVVTSILLLLTKFLDCWSTSSQLEKTSDEINPIARTAMDRFGVKTAIWGVFVLVLILVGIVGISAFRAVTQLLDVPEEGLIKLITVWGYVFLGSAISAIQLLVAHTNWTGRYNPVTRVASRVYGRMEPFRGASQSSINQQPLETIVIHANESPGGICCDTLLSDDNRGLTEVSKSWD